MFKKVVIIVCLLAIMFSLIGCNTVAGIGKDITGTAEAMSPKPKPTR